MPHAIRLFNDERCSDLPPHIHQTIDTEISGIDSDQFLHSPPSQLAEFFAEKYKLNVPILSKSETITSAREVQIERPVHVRSFHGHTVQVPGIEYVFEVPFSGDSNLFRTRAPQYTGQSMEAEISHDKIVIRIQKDTQNNASPKEDFDHVINGIESHLQSLRTWAIEFNKNLLSFAHGKIVSRRERLLKAKNITASLGYKIKPRDGAAATFPAPEVRRKISPIMPVANSAKFEPEPELEMREYEHILNVLRNMSLVMERNPSTFSTIGEEALRDHFLVQLNGHFEGEATGETFNGEGKADILIRSGGKNIFVAECKFFRGPKTINDTISQLLTYSLWRDAKIAVLIFNRNKNLTNVLQSIPGEVEKHPNFLRIARDGQRDTEFRYHFSNLNDRCRELTLTIQVFDIPPGQSKSTS